MKKNNSSTKLILVIVLIVFSLILKTTKKYQLEQQSNYIVELEKEIRTNKKALIEYNRNKYLYQYYDIQFHLNTGYQYPCNDCGTFRHHGSNEKVSRNYE